MSSIPIHCESCGAVLEPEASDGLCPRCLMANAMHPTEPSLGTTREPPPAIETVQAAFPQLEVIEFIGQGGMGWVFKARQPKLNRFVALKLLPSSLAERDASFAGRFEREGQLLARLHHPNIVAVHDSGAAGGFFYLIMEFVDGVNLRQAMRSSRFTPAQALSIVPYICDALQFAHDEGVLHRDIKPENILLDGKGRVKLADFGIAKLIDQSSAGVPPVTDETTGDTPGPLSDLTHAGATLGTPSYMAPEQRDTPGDVDNRADIYSLGVVFYELLTGELPTGSFAPPSKKSAADSRVDAIVQQALEKERTRRQSSAGEMKTQVNSISATAPDGFQPLPALRWRDRWSWDTRRVIAMALVAVVVAGSVSPWLPNLALLVVIVVLFSIAMVGARVGHRVRKLKAELGASGGEVAEALLFCPPFRGPGLAVLHPDRLELIPVKGPKSIVLLTLIKKVNEVRWFNGARLVWKRGFMLELENGQRMGLAVPDPYGRRWRALLSRGSLPEIPGEFSGQAAPVSGTPRFSRTAIAGACWVILFFIVVPATIVHEWETHEIMSHGPFASALVCFVWFVFLIPGFIAPFGATMLGWIAVIQIRRSPGRLYGLGLAVFDGLFFPLLALDYGTAYFLFSLGKAFLGWTQSYDSTQDGQLIVASCILWALLDFFIVRSVWRAVTKYSGSVSGGFDDSESRERPGIAGAETGHESRTAAGRSSAEDNTLEQARQSVQAPAICLLITGVLNCLVVAGIILILGLRLNSSIHTVFPSAVALILTILLAALACGCAVVFAALRMMQLKGYRFANAASILAILLSPGSIVGLAIGIWSLIVLSRADVREAFAREYKNSLPRLATPSERRVGTIGLALWVGAVPLALCFGLSGSWKTCILILTLLQVIALPCGIAGRKSVAGKLTVFLSTLIIGFGLPVTGLFITMNLRKEFGGMPSFERFTSSPEKPKATAHQGPPFVAGLQQGTVELLGLAEHPSNKTGAWLPDGSPSNERLPTGAGVNSADGKAMKEVAFRIRSTGTPSAPELRFDNGTGASGMGSSFSRDRNDSAVFTFVQAIACPLAARSIDLKLGVAEGDWQTVSSTAKPSVNMNSGWSGAQTSDKDGVWEGNVQMTEGKAGDVTLAFNYSIKDNFETRIAFVKTDGTMLTLSGSGSYGAGGLRHGITTMSAADFSQIKEFQLQKRNYQWIEFRNVSLEPGRKTAVETVDAAGSDTNVVEHDSFPPAKGVKHAAAPALSFGPVMKRFIAVGNTSESFYSISRDGYVPGPQPPAPDDYKSLAWDIDGQRMAQWVAFNDVDFMVEKQGSSLALIFVGMNASPCKEEDFDRYTARDLGNDDGFKQSLARQLRPDFQARQDGGKITEAFQTRSGLLGMVQVIALGDNPAGLWIRYKLVQQTAGATKNTPAPGAAMNGIGSKTSPPVEQADPISMIERNVAQQQLEKALTELEETQTALTSLQPYLGESHPQMKKLESKMITLRAQAERLREKIRQNASTR